MEPEHFYVFLDVLDNVTAYFWDNFLFQKFKTVQLNLQSLYVLTEGYDSSHVGEEIAEYSGLIKMPITHTFNLYIGNIGHPGLFNVIRELLKLLFAAEKVTISDVQFIHKCGIENHSLFCLFKFVIFPI